MCTAPAEFESTELIRTSENFLENSRIFLLIQTLIRTHPYVL